MVPLSSQRIASYPSDYEFFTIFESNFAILALPCLQAAYDFRESHEFQHVVYSQLETWPKQKYDSEEMLPGLV